MHPDESVALHAGQPGHVTRRTGGNVYGFTPSAAQACAFGVNSADEKNMPASAAERIVPVLDAFRADGLMHRPLGAEGLATVAPWWGGDVKPIPEADSRRPTT